MSEKDGKWYMLGSQTVSQLGLSVLDIREDEERKAFMKGLRASLSGTVNEEIMTPANRKTIEGIMEERKAEREKKFAAQVEAQNRKASDEMLAKAGGSGGGYGRGSAGGEGGGRAPDDHPSASRVRSARHGACSAS